MKKFFTLVMALVAVMAVNATVVTFDFSNPTSLGITAPAPSAGTNITAPVEFEGVTLTATNGSTATRIWNAGGNCELRIYNGGTITFTAEEEITAIEFAGAKINFQEITTGKAWTGSATSVTLHATATCNITSAALTIGEAPVIWEPDTISVAEANALVANKDIHDHYVFGVLMGAPFNVYDKEETVSFWLSDTENPNDSIEFFQGGAEGNTKWESLVQAQELLHKGDTVLVYAGALKAYGRAENDTITEITGGYYAEMIGANPDPEEVEYPKLLASDALALAESLEPERGKSKSTSEIYAVYGYAKVKNAEKKTYYLTDEAGEFGVFQAYQCKEIDDVVNDGDFVKVIGAIMHFWGTDKDAKDDPTKDYHNYEVSGGYLYHVDPSEAPEGIENVVLTEKAQKVMVNGVLYIVRDNKMFDVRGAQVR